jgi:hypothetical protein
MKTAKDMDTQKWVALGFMLRDLQVTAASTSREDMDNDDLLFYAVSVFNALTGGKTLCKADMTPQRRALIIRLLRGVLSVAEYREDINVRVSLKHVAEAMVWEDEQVNAA